VSLAVLCRYYFDDNELLPFLYLYLHFVYDQTEKSKDHRVKETSIHLEENRPLIERGICHRQMEEKIH
jgi:hypothetical protein